MKWSRASSLPPNITSGNQPGSRRLCHAKGSCSVVTNQVMISLWIQTCRPKSIFKTFTFLSLFLLSAMCTMWYYVHMCHVSTKPESNYQKLQWLQLYHSAGAARRHQPRGGLQDVLLVFFSVCNQKNGKVVMTPIYHILCITFYYWSIDSIKFSTGCLCVLEFSVSSIINL